MRHLLRKKLAGLAATLLFAGIANAQMPHPLSFYPYAQGNVWQYRDASTQEIVYRRYNDSVSIGADSNIYIHARYVPGQLRKERIDTSFFLFLTTFQPDYPRYKLAADSGQSWIAGRDIILPEDTAIVTVSDVYQGFVFGVLTTIKVFTFSIHFPPPQPPTWLGDEHLASGFGLVFAFIEGGSAPYLSGAIIDGVHWGEPIVGVKEIPNKPAQFSLHQNYPNPFNLVTRIQYFLPVSTDVSLRVYDILGREVAILVDGFVEAGVHETLLNGKELSSGVYFYRLEARGFVESKKLLLMK